MSRSTPNDSNKGFLSSTNIEQAFNLEHPHKSSRLAEKKATKEKSTAEKIVSDSLVLTKFSTDLPGTSAGYITIVCKRLIKSSSSYIS